jgi:hypothetical protein
MHDLKAGSGLDVRSYDRELAAAGDDADDCVPDDPAGTGLDV